MQTFFNLGQVDGLIFVKDRNFSFIKILLFALTLQTIAGRTFLLIIFTDLTN